MDHVLSMGADAFTSRLMVPESDFERAAALFRGEREAASAAAEAAADPEARRAEELRSRSLDTLLLALFPLTAPIALWLGWRLLREARELERRPKGYALVVAALAIGTLGSAFLVSELADLVLRLR